MKLVLILFIVALLFAVYKYFFATEPYSVKTELPDDLKNAKLWAKEKAFECGGNNPLTGIVDESFIGSNGDIVLSDTKSRKFNRVYKSDILQVSAYRVLIENATSKTVAPFGFIRLLTPSGNEYVKIDLYDRDEVLAARRLFDDLRNGKYPGEKCQNKAMCKGCAYKYECDNMA